jgi:O-antigen/teichoic acid export membrane protein
MTQLGVEVRPETPARRTLDRARAVLPHLRDYAQNASVEITLTILGFVSGVLLARNLGPEGRGRFAAAVLWPTWICLIIGIGLQHAFAYATGVGWASPRRLSRFATKYTLAIGLPAMIVYWAVSPHILRKQFHGTEWVPGIFSPFIALSLYTGLLLPIIQGRGDFVLWNKGRIFRNGAWTAAVLFLAVSGLLSVTRLLLSQLCILAFLGLFLRHSIEMIPAAESSDDPHLVPRLFKYGLAIYLSGLAYTVNQQLDQLLLSLRVTPSELGQYAAAATLANILLLIPTSIGPVLFSKIARSHGDKANQHSQIRIAVLGISLLLIPSGALVALAAPSITTLVYGPAFAEAGRLLRVLAVAVIFLGSGCTLSDSLRGYGKPMYATYGAALGAIVTIAGLTLTLPRFGIWGAAWVSLAAYASMALAQAILVVKALKPEHR